MIQTPRLPDGDSSSGGFALLILALAVTGGILYWQYRKGENSED